MPAVMNEKPKEEKELDEVKKLLMKLHDRMDSYDKKQESRQDDVPEERYGQYHRGGYRDRYMGRGRGYQPTRPLAGKTFQPTCFICGERGHIQRDCPTIMSQMVCGQCKRKGHISKDCPKV